MADRSMADVQAPEVAGQPDVRAFLLMVRWAEGTGDEGGYRALYGHRADRPRLFDGWEDHPRVATQTPWGATSAAGAYQFMARVPENVDAEHPIRVVTTDTWDRIKAKLGLPDFSPASQDRGAVELLRERGVLPLLARGQIEDAIKAASWEWASLPPGRYGQPMRSMLECIRKYVELGGRVAEQVAEEPVARGAEVPEGVPAGVPVEVGQREGGGLMAIPLAMLHGLLKVLTGVVPEVAKVVFDDRQQPRVEAATEVLKRVVEATRPATGPMSAPAVWNEQRAVEAVVSSPAAAAAARAALISDMDRLVGMVVRGQEADTASMDRAAVRTAGDPEMARATGPMLDRAFHALVGSLIAVFALMVIEVIVTHARPSGELVGLFIMLVTTTATVWTLTYNYRFGSSSGSKASGDAMRAMVAEQQHQQQRR